RGGRARPAARAMAPWDSPLIFKIQSVAKVYTCSGKSGASPHIACRWPVTAAAAVATVPLPPGMASPLAGLWHHSPVIRTVTATRYVTPLREGGSLPALIEADDDGLYVLKFHGAGQGPKVLVAELIAGELARAAGLPVPEIVLMELDPDLARTEPDAEIQQLIKASGGLNLALDYLPGSVTFDPLADQPDTALASSIVWFDAYVTNIDRTARNANMLMWHHKLWRIDHGAALYFHHGWREDS